MQRGYQEDLAYIHDVGFGDFSRQAAPFLLETLRAKGITGGLVIDLGCGSGIWAQALTRAGYDVLGVDLSPAMLALAKQKAPQARFQKASLLRAKLPPCAAVTALGEGVNYLFDEHGFDEVRALFARVYDSLQPGGMFIFDIIEPCYLRGANPQKTFVEGKDWAILLESAEDAATQRLTRRMTIFRQVGKQFRRSAETHVVQLCKATELAHALRQTGFRVQLVRGYGELKFRKAKAGLVAIKPKQGKL